MGIRRKELLPPIIDPWVDALWIATKYGVSRSTGQRWIIKLTQQHLTFTDGRFKRTRRKRMLRVPLSMLEEHINEFINR